MSLLVIRFFLEVADASEAESAAAEVQAQLSSIAQRTEVTIRPYWKIKEHTEVLVVSDIALSNSSAIALVKGLMGDGWCDYSEQESIWTEEDGGVSKIVGLKWAHIEVQDD